MAVCQSGQPVPDSTFCSGFTESVRNKHKRRRRIWSGNTVSGLFWYLHAFSDKRSERDGGELPGGHASVPVTRSQVTHHWGHCHE